MGRVHSVPGAKAEGLIDLLEGLFDASSTTLREHRPEGADEDAIFAEPAPGSGPGTAAWRSKLWGDCTLSATFPLGADVHAAMTAALDATGLSRLPFTVEDVYDRDWQQVVLDSYRPLQLAPGLWIVPEWQAPPDPAATNVLLRPGIAFGTGEHPTTRLCLEVLLAADVRGAAVLDWGTGSGVLAIAALLLGAATAVGTDVDEQAVTAAAANAGLNGLQDQARMLLCSPRLDDPDPAVGDGGAGPAYDVVLANILRGPLLELRSRLAGHAKPGAVLCLSGVTAEQAPAVVEAYSEQFEGLVIREREGWACITGTRL